MPPMVLLSRSAHAISFYPFTNRVCYVVIFNNYFIYSDYILNLRGGVAFMVPRFAQRRHVTFIGCFVELPFLQRIEKKSDCCLTHA